MTTPQINTQSVSMADVFKRLGYDWKELPVNELIDVSHHNIKLLAYDHINKCKCPDLIEGIIYKGKHAEYEVWANDTLLFKCSDTHMIYDNASEDYIQVSSIANMNVKGISPDGTEVDIHVLATGKEIDVIDVQMKNGNYFTNGLLSHNTGGNALKFYAGARIKTRTPTKMSPSFGEIKQQNANSANPIGIWIRPNVIKNKMGIPFRSSEIPFIFHTGVCWPLEIYKLARGYDLISKKSNKLHINGITIGKDLEDVVFNLYKMNNEDLVKILKYLNSTILKLNEKNDVKYADDVFKTEYEDDDEGIGDSE
jgi:hypothetical protein